MTEQIASFPRQAFDKVDPTDDAVFYAPPRLVTHIDDGATAALTAFYRTILPSGGVILDLMSSWVSHLPADLHASAIVGHGMNVQELDANPRLTRRLVQNLNQVASLPLEDACVDAALCCVGVQYLQNPIDVFTDVARVSRPGAPCVVSFSNRCFPTKAVAIWRALDGNGHARLVQLYLEQAGFVDVDVHVLADGSDSDPLPQWSVARAEEREKRTSCRVMRSTTKRDCEPAGQLGALFSPSPILRPAFCISSCQHRF